MLRTRGVSQFGSGIWDGKKSDPGSGINIPDPPHLPSHKFVKSLNDMEITVQSVTGCMGGPEKDVEFGEEGGGRKCYDTKNAPV